MTFYRHQLQRGVLLTEGLILPFLYRLLIVNRFPLKAKRSSLKGWDMTRHGGL
jgi:hypothetical protein